MVDGVVPSALGTVPVRSSVLFDGLGESPGDDDDVGDGAVVGAGAVDIPESGAA